MCLSCCMHCIVETTRPRVVRAERPIGYAMIVETTRPRVVRAATPDWVCDDCGDDTPSCRSGGNARLCMR